MLAFFLCIRDTRGADRAWRLSNDRPCRLALSFAPFRSLDDAVHEAARVPRS